jgi:quinoprotein relay system zinc metallohydrolase 2
MRCILPFRWRLALFVGGVLLAGSLAALRALAETEPFNFVQVAPGVYVHQGQIADFAPDNRGDISNAGVIVGSRCVAVIDTGGSIAVGDALMQAIRGVTTLPVCAVIFTHMHPDHVFGAAAFEADNPEYVANAKLPRALLLRADTYLARERKLGADGERSRLVYPSHLVESTDRIDLGGRVLLLHTWPTAHTDNDLTVRDETTGVLFLGDLAFREHTPVLDGNLKGWIKVLGMLGQERASPVVPGHGPVAGSMNEALGAEAQYLGQLRSDITEAIHAGRNLQDTVARLSAQPAGRWKLFDLYHPRNVTAGYAELEWDE